MASCPSVRRSAETLFSSACRAVRGGVSPQTSSTRRSGRDRLSGAERQHCQNGALLPPVDREHPFSVPNLEGPEELETQHGAFLHAPPGPTSLPYDRRTAHHAPVRSIPRIALAGVAIAVLLVQVDRGAAVLPGRTARSRSPAHATGTSRSTSSTPTRPGVPASRTTRPPTPIPPGPQRGGGSHSRRRGMGTTTSIS